MFLFLHIGNLCRKKNAFTARHMKREDIFAINELTWYIINCKTNKDKQVNWLKYLWISVEKSVPLAYKYCTAHNDLEQLKVVDLKPIRRGKPADISHAMLQHLYAGPRTIKKKKSLMI